VNLSWKTYTVFCVAALIGFSILVVGAVRGCEETQKTERALIEKGYMLRRHGDWLMPMQPMQPMRMGVEQ
jgi:hypothetical protein